MIDDDKQTTFVKRRLSDDEIMGFFKQHEPNCPYCGERMKPEFLDKRDLLNRDNGVFRCTGWVLGYSCTCTSKEQAYS